MAIPIPTNSRKPDETPNVLYMDGAPLIPQRQFPPPSFNHDDFVSTVHDIVMTPRFRMGVNMDKPRIGRVILDYFNV